MSTVMVESYQLASRSVFTPWTRIAVGSPYAKRIIRVCMLSFIYFGIGCLFYMQVEKWNFYESLYFLMVTASTVGYGDLSPGSNKDEEWKGKYLAYSRLFTLVYLLIGVIVVFAEASSLIADAFRPWFRKGRNVIEAMFPQKGIDIDGDGTCDFKVPRSPPAYYGKHLMGPIMLIFCVQLFCAWIFTLVVPALDFGSAFYHCLVTATTVGYGDISLPNDNARMWAFFHILISVSLLAAIIGDVGELALERKTKLHKLTLLKGQLDTDLMKSLDLDGNGVDKFEFVFGMLKKLEIVHEEDIEPFVKLFESMDLDGSGLLTPADIEAMEKRKSENDSSTHGSPNTKSIDLAAVDAALTNQKNPPKSVLNDPLTNLPKQSRSSVRQSERKSAAARGSTSATYGSAIEANANVTVAMTPDELKRFREMQMKHIEEALVITRNNTGPISYNGAPVTAPIEASQQFGADRRSSGVYSTSLIERQISGKI
jgi:hypothetical protein